ncbi:hypothetical protein MNBD_BACTEROID02-1635, partial [hydrothermal vent metagenome]
NFKNHTTNLIFIISNILLINLFTIFILLINTFTKIAGTTEYPPLSGGIVEQSGNGISMLSNVFLIIQIILMILLAFSGIKIGQNYNRTKS